MNPRESMGAYPRADFKFKAKKSLNIEMVRASIFAERDKPHYLTACKWFAYFVIGVSVGIVAFLMEVVESNLVIARNDASDWVMTQSDGSSWVTWSFLAVWCAVIVAFASFLTIEVGPGANGSGIAECIAYFNGVNYPKFISWATFIIKALCVVIAIPGQLFIGKEGPLAHIGANVGALVIHYVPIPAFDYFKNEMTKREFACAGCAAGVSTAFGAPIGGVLFSFELSKPSTFWSYEMIFRTFFASATGVYTLSLLQ